MPEKTRLPAAAILPFPTKRRRAYSSGRLDRETPPANVRLLHRLVGDLPLPPPTPLPPTGYGLLALLEALRTERRGGKRAAEPDVLGELTRMLRRWETDAEVLRQVGLAINLICANRSGRWHAD
jgi:hypothetical protein